LPFITQFTLAPIKEIDVGIKMMEDNTVRFQISPEMKRLLEKTAARERKTVSSVVESIIRQYFRNEKEVEAISRNRRRFERKPASIPAYVGDTRWQRHDFVAGTILDISLGGIKMSIPKGTRVEFRTAGVPDEFNVVFTIPTCLWPISMRISPRRVIESAEDIRFGACLINPSFQAYSALQKCLSQ
jgi:hypothetical protein